MYEPQTTGITEFGDYVYVLTKDGYSSGQFTGNTRGEETFEIRVEDTMTGKKRTGWFHKEDIFPNTEEGLERVTKIAKNQSRNES